MAETQTNIDFKIIETDDNTKVTFDKGQYIIEDGSKVYYDPTNGTSIVDRIEIGSADIEELRRELTGLYSYRGSAATLPITDLKAGYVWDLSQNVSVDTHGVILTTENVSSAANIVYQVEHPSEYSDYTHILSVTIAKQNIRFPSNYYVYYITELILRTSPSTDIVEYMGFPDVVETDTELQLTFHKENSISYDEHLAILAPTSYVDKITIAFSNKAFYAGDNIAWTAEGYWDKLAADYAPKEYVKEYVDEIYAYVDNLVGGLEDEIDTIIEDGV